jgi:hypothetical protein
MEKPIGGRRFEKLVIVTIESQLAGCSHQTTSID